MVLHNQPPNAPSQQDGLAGKLMIVRHAESEWNATGRWTGITDVHLSKNGFNQAGLLGKALEGMALAADVVYCSKQIRTHETATTMLTAAHHPSVPIITASELNERDYGGYTGKNKWEIRDEVGEEAFKDLRRGWNSPIPHGETLKMVYERVIPFYIHTIVPLIAEGKNVLIVAHGNSIRALLKYLNNLSDEAISTVEMPFGRIDTCTITPDGRAESTTSKTIDTAPITA